MKWTKKRIIDNLQNAFAWTCADACDYYGLGTEEFESMCFSNNSKITIVINAQVPKR